MKLFENPIVLASLYAVAHAVCPSVWMCATIFMGLSSFLQTKI